MFSKLHSSQWHFLKGAFERNQLPHALLFAGPEGVGKKNFALEFCQLILGSFSHPDAVFIRPIEGTITIDQIRALNWHMALKPLSSAWKIAVLEKAHLMRQEAQNAFLKTLEEPNEKRLFVLMSEHPLRLLPTVLSRTQRIVFKPLPQKVLEDFLAQQWASKKDSRFLAEFSKGLPALALWLLENREKLTWLKQELSRIEKLSKSDLADKFAWAKNLAEKPTQEITEVLRVWLFYYHNLFLKEQKTATLNRLKNILESIEKTQALLKFTYVNSRLTLENLMLDLTN